MDIADACSIDDLQHIAHRRLPRFVVDYVESGADDELSLCGNRAAYDRHAFQNRVLVDVSQVDRSVTVFGRQIASPMISDSGSASRC